jgi:hypothetical protein
LDPAPIHDAHPVLFPPLQALEVDHFVRRGAGALRVPDGFAQAFE